MPNELKLHGLSHLALNCSDMKATVEFLAKVGVKLIKTTPTPNGMGQHFFFDVGNGDSLAYFWWADHLGVPRVTGSEMYDGAMHHVAFEIHVRPATVVGQTCRVGGTFQFHRSQY